MTESSKVKGESMKKIFFVTSGKGGTGKSIFSVNIGAALAMKGHKTLLVDMNTGMRTLDLLIGAENKAIYDFGDVVSGRCAVKDAILKCDTVAALDVIVATQNAGEFYTESAIKKVIASVSDDYEYVILDGAPGLDKRIDICASVADETIIVLTPDNASLRAAEAVDARLIKNKIIKRKFVLNRVNVEFANAKIEPNTAAVNERIGADIIGMILDDDNIRVSSSMGVPIVLMKESYLADNFMMMADKLI